MITVPGDKSITQRALIMAALADGKSPLSGLLDAADPRSTANALRALGAEIPPWTNGGPTISVRGRGLRGLEQPSHALDLGNSGTGARLLLGVLAAQSFDCTVTGDDSLRSRPMKRVTGPLELMGAQFDELGEPDRLPLEVRGRPLRPLDIEVPVSSAQVKSALMLAGLVGGQFVRLTQPRRSRDHTERMFEAFGISVMQLAVAGGWRVELRDPPERLAARPIEVPGDFSSAAFFIVLALMGGTPAELTLGNVGINPTRTGLLSILERMAGEDAIEITADPGDRSEPRAALSVTRTRLRATTVGGDEIPAAIDEIPLVAVAAARAEGTTRITGAGELRLKETDRIKAMVSNLRAVGVAVEELPDGLEISGSDAPLQGRIKAFHDHRIAMAFGVLGALPENDIEVDDPDVVDVSYPGFWNDLDRVSRTTPRASRPKKAVVTVDGPAGSGKSTTARAVAGRLGYRHLDSGALYRALTWALLDSGREPASWPELTRKELDGLTVGIELSGSDVQVSVGQRILGDELRGESVTRYVSELAGLRQVRDWLLDHQRSAASRGGLVADGRDMGTVVFPEADVKIFLTAELRERARRRLGDKGRSAPDADEVSGEAKKIEARDALDSQREHSPLRSAPDAVHIDTTQLDFDQQVATIVELVRQWERQRQS